MRPGFEKITDKNGAVILRPIGWKDIPNFWRLLSDSKIMAAFQLIPVPRNLFHKSLIAVGGTAYYKKQPFHYIINDGGKGAGCLTFRDDGVKGELSISGLAILKKFRLHSMGLSARAFYNAVRHIDNQNTGIRSIKAITTSNNETVQRMMLRAGFKETEASINKTIKAPAEWRDPTLKIFEARLDLREPEVRKKYGLPSLSS